jgi:hypothetical protein
MISEIPMERGQHRKERKIERKKASLWRGSWVEAKIGPIYISGSRLSGRREEEEAWL